MSTAWPQMGLECARPLSAAASSLMPLVVKSESCESPFAEGIHRKPHELKKRTPSIMARNQPLRTWAT
jgi:hypothetical protein